MIASVPPWRIAREFEIRGIVGASFLRAVLRAKLDSS
jgi:hypothetical protein